MAKVLLIPDGPANLQSYFPTIDWRDIKDYYVEMIDDQDEVLATTVVNKHCTCCGNNGVRVHFLNFLGEFDAVNFRKPIIINEDQSSNYRKGLSYPLQKTDSVIERSDVRSNDTYQARRNCFEHEMEWIQECQNSTKAFMEWRGAEEQPPSYIPVIILDKQLIKKKNVNDFHYEFVLTYQLSNEYITVKN
ncbi:MAG: hypothetical protein ACTHMM_16650 [Agriterribacter sp.]